MLKIESIQNGIVIDHIPAGKGMDIYKLLELDSQKQSIALLQSVRSEKYGCKDLIKIEGLTEPERLEVLGYLNDAKIPAALPARKQTVSTSSNCPPVENIDVFTATRKLPS